VLRNVAVLAFAGVLGAGCSGGGGGKQAAPTTSTSAASTSSTLPPGIDPKLTRDIAKAREARVQALAAVFADPNSLAEAKTQARARGAAIATYVAFITAHNWPQALQADVDAVVSAWNKVAAPFAHLEALPATASPADVNKDIDVSNRALPAAGAADDKLSKDLDRLLCGPRPCKHIQG
jgi:hypothetical protein